MEKKATYVKIYCTEAGILEHLVVFSADLYGSEVQYKKLVDLAISGKADSLIIGGDIAPLSMHKYLVYDQRIFISEELPKLLSPLKASDCRVYLIMGNDDCACNMDILEKNERLFRVIHGRRLTLTDDFDIVGYSFVPITPFVLKDWEKFDLTEVPKHLKNSYVIRKTLNYRIYGVKSTLEGWKNFCFTEDIEKEDSIQKDLYESVFTEKTEETVYVIHTPPDNTNLDQGHDRSHLGSMAVRMFIEEYQPYLTLHGHIHETVAMSGDFEEAIGNTLSLTAGNHDFRNSAPSDLAVVTFDLYDLKTAKRRVI